MEPAGQESERPASGIDPISRRGDDGCLKPLLYGCGSVAFFLAIALFVFVWKADDLLRWTLEMTESQVVSILPEEVDEARRERLHEAFAAAREALASGRADAFDLQRFQTALIDYSRAAAAGLTLEDVDRLIVALERLGGVERPPPPDAPSRDDGEVLSRTAPLALLAPSPGAA